VEIKLRYVSDAGNLLARALRIVVDTTPSTLQGEFQILRTVRVARRQRNVNRAGGKRYGIAALVVAVISSYPGTGSEHLSQR
jgi:hypothetical protein